jgi:hypothetical protein
MRLADQRTFGADDLAALAAMLAGGGRVLPVRQFIDLPDKPERLVVLRHDMDHDAENSLRLARWEAALGYRSSYFVLHSDWYWRVPGQREPSRFSLRILDRIASLGHEIGLHNNAITVALLSGDDPARVLDRELTFLRGAGFEITGSVAHGDPICRVAGYVNDELFLESAHRMPGELERTIRYTDPKTGRLYEVLIRSVPMAQFGLRYEANLIGRLDFSLSDAGGHWNQPFAETASSFRERGGALSILTHPVYWAFGPEVVRPRPPRQTPPLRRPPGA